MLQSNWIMGRLFVCAVAVFVLWAPVAAQKLVSSELNGTLQAADALELQEKTYARYKLGDSPRAIDLHKITYTSLDAKNRPAQLTGLVALPVNGAPKGLVVYCHGTTVDRKRSPSKYNGTGEAPETIEAVTGFALGGYAVVLPDYIGLGDHKAAHPYPASKVNARSGVDIIPAARELAERSNYTIGPNLYITGYSEGGGVAMALVQSLQAMSGQMYDVTAAAPASGPYDLSGTTRLFMLEDSGEQVGFILRLYLTSYAVNFLVDDQKVRWRDFYKPVLANALAINYGNNPTDDGVIKNIGITTALMRSKNRLANVLQPKFLTAMQKNDLRNPFVRLLKDNDTFDWTPRVPMLLIAIDGDTVVSQENTVVAMNAMRKRGIGPDKLRSLLIKDAELNHLNGIAPALSKARAFFDAGFTAVPDAR